jgi:hypothetical protein
MVELGPLLPITMQVAPYHINCCRGLVLEIKMSLLSSRFRERCSAFANGVAKAALEYENREGRDSGTAGIWVRVYALARPGYGA